MKKIFLMISLFAALWAPGYSAAAQSGATAIFADYDGGEHLTRLSICETQRDGDTYYARSEGSWNRAFVWDSLNEISPRLNYVAVCDTGVFIGRAGVAAGDVITVTVTADASGVFALEGEIGYPAETLAPPSLRMKYFDMERPVTDCVAGTAYGTADTGGRTVKTGYLAAKEPCAGRILFTSSRLGRAAGAAGNELLEITFEALKDADVRLHIGRLNAAAVADGAASPMKQENLSARVSVSAK